jgi:hypothetical protein
VAEWYGLPVLALFLLFLVMSARQRVAPPALAAAVVFFTVSALLDTGIFHRHAWDHAFWALAAGPGLCLGAAAVLHRSSSNAGLIRTLTALLILLGMGTLGTWKTWEAQNETRTDRYRLEARMVNAATRPDDVILTSEPWLQQIFYIEGRAFSHIRTRLLLDDLLRRYQELKLRARIHAFLPEESLSSDTDLQEIMALVAPLCPAPTRVGRYRVYTFTPP